MSRKVTRQSRLSTERIKAAANSRLMRLAQKRIVGDALLLDRVANSHLWVPAASLHYSESRRFPGGFCVHKEAPVGASINDKPGSLTVTARISRSLQTPPESPALIPRVSLAPLVRDLRV